MPSNVVLGRGLAASHFATSRCNPCRVESLIGQQVSAITVFDELIGDAEATDMAGI